MKTWLMVASVAVFVLAVVVSFAWADGGEKPVVLEGRFQLHNGVNRADNLVFKIDTQTGETWVLNTNNHGWEIVR